MRPTPYLNRLTPLRFDHRDTRSRVFWLYRCACGNEKVINKYSVDCGDTKSCGCLRIELAKRNGKENKTHGEGTGITKTKEFRCWINIKTRCYNNNAINFSIYGGRGIVMYEPWINDYMAFRDWLINNIGRCPKGKSLDRKDNDGNYEPGNLRWATAKEQRINQRKRITVSNEEYELVLAFRASKN